MARTPIVAGNWKMNTSAESARNLVRAIRDGGVDQIRGVEKVVCPPFTFLHVANEAAAGSSVKVGAQNMHWEEKGAFTGEVSPSMLAGLVEYVIIGHSERRAYFCESDETVNKKLRSALAHGLRAIVCVGETGDERQAGETESVLKRQVQGAFGGVEVTSDVVVAYEPVWAIGTGVAATPQDASDAIGLIRREVAGIIGERQAEEIRILYGGSVTPDNIGDFVALPGVDGGLVGGASLVAESFLQMCRRAAEAAGGPA
jgi:triosephosphate isomerase (TIM)